MTADKDTAYFARRIIVEHDKCHSSAITVNNRLDFADNTNINRRDEYKLLMASKRGDAVVQLGHSKKQATGPKAKS